MFPRWTSGAAACVLTLSSLPAQAHGLFYPNRAVTLTPEQFYEMPQGSFEREILQIAPEIATTLRAVPPRIGNDEWHTPESLAAQASRQQLADASAVLAGRRLSPAQRRAALSELSGLCGWLQQAADSAPEPPSTAAPPIPEWLPIENRHYLAGAVAYRQGRLVQAVQQWRALLALPAAQRQQRSTWAAFMVGLTIHNAAPERAAGWFALVRQLAAAGYADPLGLAAASYGEEARTALDQGQSARALSLYRTQLATGDASAFVSIKFVARRVFLQTKPAAMPAMLAAPMARRVLLAYLVSTYGYAYGGRESEQYDDGREVDAADAEPDAIVAAQVDANAQAAHWLDALEKMPRLQAPEAERLAWAAYQSGRIATAARWVALAPDNSAMSLWLRSKLALRAGKAADGIALLRRAIRALPPDLTLPQESWPGGYGSEFEPFRASRRAHDELAVLLLSQRDYADALDAFLQQRSWLDAAYVAEQLLSVQELQHYVDSRLAGLGLRSYARDSSEYYYVESATINDADRLRALLARRLQRADRSAQAVGYYPAALRRDAAQLASHLQLAGDATADKLARARARWQAARLLRKRGLELFATELQPDWAVYGAQFEEPAFAELRPKQGSIVVSRDELQRAAGNASPGLQRFSYRYRAAAMAWEAAAAMPDGSDETARVLAEAGGWLAARDPQAALPFYRALLQRCGRTSLGRQARQRGWLP